MTAHDAIASAVPRLLYFGSRTWVDLLKGCTLRQTHHLVRTSSIIPEGPRSRAIMQQVSDDSPFHMVQGDADGADILSRLAADLLLLSHDDFPVDLKLDGQWPSAGHRRNERMAWKGKPTGGRAFISGRIGTALSKGSAGMLAILDRMGVPVILHRENGIEVRP